MDKLASAKETHTVTVVVCLLEMAPESHLSNVKVLCVEIQDDGVDIHCAYFFL